MRAKTGGGGALHGSAPRMTPRSGTATGAARVLAQLPCGMPHAKGYMCLSAAGITPWKARMERAEATQLPANLMHACIMTFGSGS